MKAGDYFRDFTGPLGCPSEFIHEDLEELKKKKILFVGGGVGAAPVYPQVKWMKEHGIDDDVIIGSKTKDLLILEDQMEAAAGNYYPCTDDGSYGHAGMVTTKIEQLVRRMQQIRCLYRNRTNEHDEIQQACFTKKLENPDSCKYESDHGRRTGRCGACRLIVGGEVKFACVDGPEFDGHLVDFDNAMKRQQMYKTQGRSCDVKITGR